MTSVQARAVVLVGSAPAGLTLAPRGPVLVLAIGWPLTAAQRAVVDGLQRETVARGYRFEGEVVASLADASTRLLDGDEVHALVGGRGRRRLRRLGVSVRAAR